MKTKLIAIASILGICSLSSQAASEATKNIYGALLYNIQKSDNMADRLDSMGRLNIDMAQAKVSVSIARKMNYRCPPNVRCMVPMVMPMPFIVELPIVKIEKDSCQNTIYTAKRDQRDANGDLETLQIINHSESVCEIYYPSMIQAKYRAVSADNEVAEISALATALVQGGLSHYYLQSQLSCSEHPHVADNSVQMTVSQVTGTNLDGTNFQLPLFATVTRSGFAGIMSQSNFMVTRFVSSTPGQGEFVNSVGGLLSLQLPVVSSLPEGGRYAVLNAELSNGEKLNNFVMTCKTAE